MKIKELSEKVHDLKKKVHGLSRIEKGKVYGGDKTILYDKMGLIEEEDIDKYKGRVGIKTDLDLAHLSDSELDELLI